MYQLDTRVDYCELADLVVFYLFISFVKVSVDLIFQIMIIKIKYFLES